MIFIRRFTRFAFIFAVFFLMCLSVPLTVQGTGKQNAVYAEHPAAAVSAAQSTAPVSADYLYPTGDMQRKKIIALPFEQTADYPLSATASIHPRRVRALAVTPIVGGNRYGYNWLGTANGFSSDERNVMLAVYEALDKWAVSMYNGTDDFVLDSSGDYSTGGRIDFSSAIQSKLPLDGDINATLNSPKTNRSVRLVFLSYNVFQLDNPQYYQMMPWYPVLFSDGSKTKISSIVPALAADCILYADRQKIQARIESEYKTYLNLIKSQNATDPYDIVRLVHDMICAKNDYSYIFNSSSNKYEPDINEPAHDIRGVMDPGSTGPVCEAYAESFTYIINRLGVSGLEAVTVVGTAGGGGHAWNMVRVNGAWYFLDITWNNLDDTNPNSSQYDDGNKMNLLYYKFFLSGTGSKDWGHGSVHNPADSSPTSFTGGYFSFDFPTASSADYNRKPVSRKNALPPGGSRYLTDNGFYGKNGIGAGAFNTETTQDDYDYIITKTAKPYSNNLADNPLVYGTKIHYGPYKPGTYYPGKPVPLYIFPYSNGAGSPSLAFDDYADDPMAADYTAMGFPVRVPLAEGRDYTVVAEPGKTGDEIRIWFYGTGSNYRGVDFASAILEAAPITPPAPPPVPPPAADTVISINNIGGVTAPAAGSIPVAAVTETAQYTGTVTWSPSVNGTFGFDTVYTASITLTAKQGFTLQGVPTNFFAVAGATAVNAAGSGVITAVFSKTAVNPQIQIDRDNADIAAAKNKVEQVSYTVTYAECPNDTAALARINGIIGGLMLNGVTYSINRISYTPAAAGTEAMPRGTNGELKFTVTLNKGAGTAVTTIGITLIVTPEAYVPADTGPPEDTKTPEGTGGSEGTGTSEGTETPPASQGTHGAESPSSSPNVDPYVLYLLLGIGAAIVILVPLISLRKKKRPGEHK